MTASPWILTAAGGPAELDRVELRRGLAVLPDPERGVELRALPSAAFAVLPGSDLDALEREAARLAQGAAGVYYSLNPVPVGLPHRARVGDVLARRWLLVDVDPVKAEKDASATDAEKAAANALALAVRDDLDGRGWPAPVLVDSGNGYHLLYRVDLPADAAGHALLKRVLYALADAHACPGAAVDRATHNASRVAKLPGTWARKGAATPERPHRPVRLLHVPDPLEVVAAEQLQEVAGVGGGQEAPAQPAPRPDPWSVRASSADGGRAYARRALDHACNAVLLAVPGPAEGRNNRVNREAYGMGGLVAAGLILRQEAEDRLLRAALAAGLPHAEAWATIQSGIIAGMAAPRQAPAELNGQAAGPAAAALPAGQSVIVRASAVVTRKVEWLWPYRIPRGKLTTFAGVGGLGKTFVLCDVVARVTRGGDWPDGVPGELSMGAPGQVLYVSGEDEPEDTLVPRMIELGAVLDRVAFLRTEVLDRFTLADLATLDRAAADMGPGLAMVAVDPPTAYLGGVNDHKNAELRGLLAPLKNWAARQRVGVAMITHVNKGGTNVEAMMRVIGGVAWVNAVRAAHLFAKDPDDGERVLFCPMKSNNGKARKALAYKIQDLGNDLARVEWLGEVDTTADDAVGRAPVRRSVVAADWLRERFGEKREWASDELFKAAGATGVSRNALFEAKKKLDLPPARKVTHENGNTEWVWWVPPDWPGLPPRPAPSPHKGEEEGGGEPVILTPWG